MISISNLAKSYGARVLFEDVSLKLVPGSRYGLVGANGSGKTTFLNILAGDEPCLGRRAPGSCARTIFCATRT
jgi:ATPase subunit of ABC transporter with duplicated ATPase domains